MAEAAGIGRSGKEMMLEGSAAALPVTVAASGFVSTGSRLLATGATAPTGAGSLGLIALKTSGVLAYPARTSSIGGRISNATWLGTSMVLFRCGGATKGFGAVRRGVDASSTIDGTR